MSNSFFHGLNVDKTSTEDLNRYNVGGVTPEEKFVEKYNIVGAEIMEPRYDARQSFGGKCAALTLEPKDGAVLEHQSNPMALISYGTIVATLDENRMLHDCGKYSQTTMRHIREFLKEYSKEPDNVIKYPENFKAYHEKNDVKNDLQSDRTSIQKPLNDYQKKMLDKVSSRTNEPQNPNISKGKDM